MTAGADDAMPRIRQAGAPPPADIRPSPSSRLDTATVTAAEGRVCNATVNVACPPASVACSVTAPTSSPCSSSALTAHTVAAGSAS